MWLIKDTIGVMVAIRILVPNSSGLTHGRVGIYASKSIDSILQICLLGILASNQ